MELTSEEGRVLGCLVEKQLTTPQLYPLTDKALIAACNQTSSRDPVVSYDVTTVRKTALSLREKGLLRMVHRPGERSHKHQHLLDTALALNPGQVALLAVLLLRGPQTVAELRARSERMHAFDTHAQAQEALDALSDRDDPLVARLERQPGRKEARYGQLLVDAELASPVQASPVQASPVQASPVQAGPVQAGPVVARPLSDRSAQPDSLTSVSLARQVELLRAEVAELRTQVSRLQSLGLGAPLTEAYGETKSGTVIEPS
jgi:uncharacterized protein YceH (UPF0502 family)